MGEQFLFDYFWIPILLWIGLYFSDYALTLHGAELYHGGGKNHLTIEGSYELTPYYQADIDRFRQFSSRFYLALLSVTVFLLILRGLATRAPFIFTFGVGVLILIEAVAHARHIRNIVSFRFFQKDEGVQGKIEFARWLSYRLSAAEFLTFAVIFLGLAGLLQSWFFLGGALGCTRITIQHGWLSGQTRASTGQPSSPTNV